MATKDQRSAGALVAAERLYKRKPDATTGEFRKVCERADRKMIGSLSNREFNASYVLPFRRSRALRGRKKKVSLTKSTSRRGLSAREKVARLVRQRDAQVMEAASDPRKAYDVAAGVEEFAAKLLTIVGVSASR